MATYYDTTQPGPYHTVAEEKENLIYAHTHTPTYLSTGTYIYMCAYIYGYIYIQMLSTS